MFVDGVIESAPLSPHSSGCSSLEGLPHNEVFVDPNRNHSAKEVWNQLEPKLSPQSSSGYQSSQTSGDEAIDGNIDDNSESNGQNRTGNVKDSKTEISDWNYEEFDPKNPYLYEPLTYPPEQELHLPIEVSRLLYIPSKSLPKRIARKRVSRSPEIKPKISKSTGRPKRSSQFLSPDSPSEGSDSD